MKILNRALGALSYFSAILAAQTGPSADLHLTINYPSASVVATMFGSLPRGVALIEVTACNDTPSALLLSNGRVVQALRRSGIQALSRDAAISAMQSAENRTWQNILLRNSTHAMNIVNFLVISKALSLGPALSSALPGIQALMDAIVPEFARDASDHQYLNFDRDALPDKTQLSPLDCATGMMFTAKAAGSQPLAPAEIAIDVPAMNPSSQIPSAAKP